MTWSNPGYQYLPSMDMRYWSPKWCQQKLYLRIMNGSWPSVKQIDLRFGVSHQLSVALGKEVHWRLVPFLKMETLWTFFIWTLIYGGTGERRLFALHVDCCLLVFGCFYKSDHCCQRWGLWMEKEGSWEVAWKRKHDKEDKGGNQKHWKRISLSMKINLLFTC